MRRRGLWGRLFAGEVHAWSVDAKFIMVDIIDFSMIRTQPILVSVDLISISIPIAIQPAMPVARNVL